MAENSHISWTNHTFNPWIGCTKVSPACDGCYAQAMMEGRYHRVIWGAPGIGEGTRDRTKDWSKPRKWNREAAAAPGETFVFCASLADVFDNAVPREWRRDLFKLIRATPNLTWLILTKRPQNVVKMVLQDVDQEGDDFIWPRNAALGASIEDKKRLALNQAALERAARAITPAFIFWSCEPLLEDLGDVSGILPDWVITGGETDQGAHKARPANPDWYRSLRDQCAAAGVPFHFKQWGEWQPYMGQVPTNHNPAGVHHFSEALGTAPVFRFGKEVDPNTLDGVLHRARPEVVRAARDQGDSLMINFRKEGAQP